MTAAIAWTAEKLSQYRLEALLASTREVEDAERRSDVRHSFFAPVTLAGCEEPSRSWSAFSREISASGIGLLHNMPLPKGRVYELTIGRDGTGCSCTAEVVWCRPAGEGWYLSGWRFVSRG
jgi:hypothetical protein